MLGVTNMDELIFANPIHDGDTIEKFRVKCGKAEKIVAASQLIEFMREGKIEIANLKLTASGTLEWIPPRVAKKSIEEEQLRKKKESIIQTNSQCNTAKDESVPEPAHVTKPNETVVTEVPSTSDGSGDYEEIKQLVEKLNKAREVYEQGVDEIMTNFEYDALYDKLVALEKKTGIILSNSPTHNVGYEVVSKLPKYTHETPMLSLEKTKDREELISFLNGREGVLSWKLDGLTIVLTYENGELVSAITRGNGTVGEVVTSNAKHFKNIPHKIPFKGKLVVRGEATIDYKMFNKINESLPQGTEPYKNPRNLCSGTVRQLDSKITAQRNVQMRIFELITADGYDIPKYVDEQFKFVKSLGFESVEYIVVSPKMTDPNFILLAIQQFEKLVETYDVPTDGLVLSFRDKEYGMSLGRTAKSYKHSIAFKWKDEIAESHLRDIEWQVGRSGVITPVAIFDPVDLEGSTVSRASLHNLSILEKLLGQPYVGESIGVYKANMIIPTIAWGGEGEDDTECDNETLFIPNFCPCCGEYTEIKVEESGVRTLWCTNYECSARGNSKLSHFVKRDCMNIEGISDATLQTLVEAGIVTDFPSIYHIKDFEDEIVELEGFGYTSFKNMVDAIEKSRDVKLCNLIYALGIPNVGLSTSKLICDYFNNDIAKTVTADYGQLICIDGIGDVIAESFTDYFADPDNAQMFIDLVKELNIQQPEAKLGNSMAGVTICVTGAVNIFSSRREVEELIVKLGGKLTKSVSRSTSYLVTNDTTTGSRKNKAAAEYGIEVLTEQQFIDKFNLSQYIN
jgi:DNA ligase (NAD+)